MMYQQGCHPLFQWTEEEKQEILKEVGMTDKEMKEDVDAVIEWFEKQPHLSEAGIDRDMAEKMVLMSKGSREKAKRRIDNYYKYRGLAPEFIQNREKILSGDSNVWTFHRQILIPKLFKNKRITVIDFPDADLNNFLPDMIHRNSFLFADMRLKWDYILGEIWVINLKDMTLSHLLRLNPISIQKAAKIVQEGLGMRIFGIHVLNAPSIAQQLLKFFRQFISPKIMDRVVLHESIEDLYNHIPKEYLPKDYGGTQPSMQELIDKTEKELTFGKTQQHLIDCMKYVSNEKLRPGGGIDEEFLAGSFKKLDFD